MLKRMDDMETDLENVFDMTRYFNGTTRAWGVFEDRFGRVRKTFDVTIKGHWQGDVFIMDERFRYSDGVTDVRKWFIELENEGRSIIARCNDCVGEARGVSERDQISLDYLIKLKIGGRDVVVRFKDRLYRMNDRIVLNRATMSKWGVKLGDVTLCFERT